MSFICIFTVLVFTSAFVCASEEPAVPKSAAEPTASEQKLFDLINAQRVRAKLHPLIFVPQILEDCRVWAEKLHGERRLYHWGGGYENCSRGYSTPKAAFTGWRNSPGHNALLHSSTAKYAAVGEHESYRVFRVAVSVKDYQTRRERKTPSMSTNYRFWRRR